MAYIVMARLLGFIDGILGMAYILPPSHKDPREEEGPPLALQFFTATSTLVPQLFT